MKQSLACIWVLSLAFGCSNSDAPPAGGVGTAGTSGSVGSVGSAGAVGTAGTGGTGGAPGTAGASTSGGGASAGTAGASVSGGVGGVANAAGASGSAGAAGSSGGAGGGGTTSTAFKCPAGPFDAPVLGGTAMRVAGAPPLDTFNNTGNNFTNVEGPVWIGDSLYFSEMTSMTAPPPARILKIAPGNVVSVAVPDSGSNGLAVDGSGNLIAAVHKDGSISQVALPSGVETAIVNMFGMPPARFNSPNDLAIRSDGTIYFSDPNFQAASPNPQSAQRLYRITPAPTRTVSIATNTADTTYLQPNGVTLSLDEKTLYVSGSGLKKFPVMTDGTLGVSSDFVAGQSGDGMAIDCSGNLYVAGGSGNIRVYSPAGALLGMITAGGTTTNVAFGGTDRKTLYITAQGSGSARGVYSIAMNVPGYPY